VTAVLDLPSLEGWPTLGDNGDELHYYNIGGRLPRTGDLTLCELVKRSNRGFHSKEAARQSGLPLCGDCARVAKARGWSS
jgi:hypothetical protein